ncbi:MAG: DUF3341 domain-containing protein [Acidobacteria bacterium]|nr:DUF3341 domain-containing protein [Acidobacteriota bacterium]
MSPFPVRIIASFHDLPTVQQALADLEHQGIGRNQWELFSSQPVGVDENEKSFIARSALIGGILGAVGGGGLAAGTAVAMGLQTGGMPTVAYAPVGIIVFALGGLGAVIGTLISFFAEAGLARFPDPAEAEIGRRLSRGETVLSVSCQPHESPRVEKILKLRGAEVYLEA